MRIKDNPEGVVTLAVSSGLMPQEIAERLVHVAVHSDLPPDTTILSFLRSSQFGRMITGGDTGGVDNEVYECPHCHEMIVL